MTQLRKSIPIEFSFNSFVPPRLYSFPIRFQLWISFPSHVCHAFHFSQTPSPHLHQTQKTDPQPPTPLHPQYPTTSTNPQTFTPAAANPRPTTGKFNWQHNRHVPAGSLRSHSTRRQALSSPYRAGAAGALADVAGARASCAEGVAG